VKKFISILIALSTSIAFLQAKIAVNQVGFQPGNSKYVFFSEPVGKFFIIDHISGEKVFEAKTKLWKKNDPSTGQTVYRGEFGALRRAGTYHIQTPDNKVSAPFSIAGNVYKDLYDKSLKSFYIQRCGMQLSEEFAGDFAHDACHTEDGHFHPSCNKEGMGDVTGGWHDAGDYGKYVVNAAYSLGVMFMGYELFPGGFRCDNIAIAESGNGIPDFLDECRYELEWLLKMQGEDGGVYHKITGKNFKALDLKPEEDLAKRFILYKSTAATADFAVATAMAARIYLDDDAEFSASCKKAALRAWTYLEQYPEISPDGGYKNPEDVKTGQYDDWDDRDERLWAAIELYRSFGDAKHLNYFEKYINDVEAFPSEITWRFVSAFANMSYLAPNGSSKNPGILKHVTRKLEKYCKQMLRKRNENGYHVLLEPGEYKWGSLQLALNSGFVLLFGSQKFSEPQYLEVAMDQFHYCLGANGLNQSFVTGFGRNNPKKVHNRICSLTNNWQIFPGFLVGGPNEDLEDPELQKMFSEEVPPALIWLDHEGSYASNETCINWNAILLVFAGYLNQKGL